MQKTTVKNFEDTVLSKEEIKVIIRAPANTEVTDFEYDRKAAGSTSVTDWLDQRIRPLVGEHEISVIDGNLNVPHGRMKLETLRKTYEK